MGVAAGGIRMRPLPAAESEGEGTVTGGRGQAGRTFRERTPEEGGQGTTTALAQRSPNPTRVPRAAFHSLFRR